MIMENEQLKYADKILRSHPEDAFEYRMFERELPSEENPNPAWPDWQSELLLMLVGDGLLSKSLMEDEFDYQKKYAYSITPKGADLVNKEVTYGEFLIKKMDNEKKEETIQNLTLWKLKYSWILSVIAIIISILALIFR